MKDGRHVGLDFDDLLIEVDLVPVNPRGCRKRANVGIYVAREVLMPITIASESDWKQLADQGVNAVLDPMVVRCGELFLRGVKEATFPEAVWDLLEANIHGVAMFFDRLVLDEKIPIFNYGDTFDMRLNFDQRVFSRINDYDNALYDINTGFGPDCQYDQVKRAALAELAKVYDGTHRVSQNLASDILGELSAAEYEWSPSLYGLPYVPEPENERRLAAFLLGGLIFGGYAQRIEGDHVLAPKRSRLFLAVALGKDSVGRLIEENLFAELKSRSHFHSEDLPWTPSLFPYLLSKARVPLDLIELVAKLRKTTEVREYRRWLREVLRDAQDGKVSIEKRKDVKALLASIDRTLGSVPRLPTVEVKVTVADVVKGKPPGAVDFTPTLKTLWGWFLENLPGNRYRKLLTRAVVADNEYPVLMNRIKNLWNAG
jgi:hypothetical protein